jgi:hypothetical protein
MAMKVESLEGMEITPAAPYRSFPHQSSISHASVLCFCVSAAGCCGGVDVDDRPVGNPKRRYDEHNSKFSLSKKPWFIELVEKAKLQKVMPASFTTAPDNL